MIDLDDYSWLTDRETAVWLQKLAHDSRPVHQQLTQLRKQLSTTRAQLLVQQTMLRRRAVSKFGPWAKQMFFTEIGLQQATDRWLSTYKAVRYQPASSVHDLCCGIGGDLIGLATRHEQTVERISSLDGDANRLALGWDLAPHMVLLAAANLRNILDNGILEKNFLENVAEEKDIGKYNSDQIAIAQLGDVESLSLPLGAMWHLDPDRRPQGRRSTHVELHRPGPEMVTRLLKTHPSGAVKLAPACQVPADWEKSAELEWISRDRECRQLVVWFGSLTTHPGKRRATLLVSPQMPSSESVAQDKSGPRPDHWIAHSFVGQVGLLLPTAPQLGQYLYDPDSAVLAANLLGELANQHGLAALVPSGAYLTSDHPIDHPLLARFIVLEQIPLRIKPLAKYLSSCDIGSVEIKKRGVNLNPSTLRRQLKLRGSQSATLILARLGQREVAILAQRQAQPNDGK